ncbi:uncharacterized protein MAM_06909 [Metarhizium album ARSEF 1941]|uniref:Uncharacterized protein n=1 Tax=Metarhizium album (strain ARSEF 1941) TaxID=1081103 RepID=A0A0B2WMM3_METAS|nr:uncharacterized protein MAM_06909 [Metarhizium album ARSEF 1941]KHN95198.1 hypothetical protein MAM_06909 [Metarhizium album ARSEF 1941]
MKSTIIFISAVGLTLAAPQSSCANGVQHPKTGTAGKLPWKPQPWNSNLFEENEGKTLDPAVVQENQDRLDKCARAKRLDEDLCGTKLYCEVFDRINGIIENLDQSFKDYKFEYTSQKECLEAREEPTAQSSTSAAPKPPGMPQQPPAKTKTQQSSDERLQAHCGRFGDEKAQKSCMFAARRCTAQVPRGAPVDQFLACVDRMQFCADSFNDINTSLDECLDKTKRCSEEKKLPLGDLTKLAECTK